MLRPFYITLAFTGMGIMAYSQAILTSAGGTLKNENLEANWTLGEPFVDDLSGTSLNATSGFNQGFFITPVSIAEGNSSFSIYPNPVAGRLMIQSALHHKYELISGEGEIVSASGSLEADRILDFSALPSGIYLLRITVASGARQTYKIIKL